MKTVGDIYNYLDSIAPFASQASFDNSGLLVGDRTAAVEKMLVAIDCSTAVVEQAKRLGCQLIVTHHPVIFKGLRSLSAAHPVYHLAQAGIATIASHTPFDIASDGINDTLVAILREPLALGEKTAVLEDGFGGVYECNRTILPAELAAILQDALGCGNIRYSIGSKPIRRIGIVCGSGGEILEEAIEAGCDAFITGDVKHDRWYYAQDRGVSLFDCGHYALEQPGTVRLYERLKAAFPTLTVLCAESTDPVCNTCSEA